MNTNLKKLNSTQVFEAKETIKPIELSYIDNTSDKDINSILLTKIQNKFGNKCNEMGYIFKDSIEIISRSIGNINTSHFNGDMYFNIKVRAEVCIPLEGNSIKCKVVGRNRIGVYALSNPIHIILTSAHHSDNIELFNTIDKDDLLEIEIITHKFKLNSEHIQVLGKFKKKIHKKF